MLHYDPQHVSSSTLLILRRTYCIITASGIVTFCQHPYSMHYTVCSSSQPAYCTLFTESDVTRGYGNTICPPEDDPRCCLRHGEDRNVTYILLKNKGIVH